jgi:hypothetical protein
MLQQARTAPSVMDQPMRQIIANNIIRGGWTNGIKVDSYESNTLDVLVIGGNAIECDASNPAINIQSGSWLTGLVIGPGGNAAAVTQGISTDRNYLVGGVMDGRGDWVVHATPESALTADVGSTARRTNGSTGTSFYAKESGSGNTGWAAK